MALLACVAAVLFAAELLSGGTAIVLAHARGIPTADWFTAAGLRHATSDYANAVLTAAAFGAIGMMTGVLVRSTPIALGIGLAWLGPLEHIVQLGWSGAANWFPGLLVGAIATGGSTVTTYQRALLAALIYAALTLTAGIVTFTRRDVSV